MCSKNNTLIALKNYIYMSQLIKLVLFQNFIPNSLDINSIYTQIFNLDKPYV